MKWMSILEYASYNFAVLWQIFLLSSPFMTSVYFSSFKGNFFKNTNKFKILTKVCFYSTADTLFWGCTETCQSTNLLFRHIYVVSSLCTCSEMTHTILCPPSLFLSTRTRTSIQTLCCFSLHTVDAWLPYLVQNMEGISGFLQPGFDVFAGSSLPCYFGPWSFLLIFTGLLTLTFSLMVFVDL